MTEHGGYGGGVVSVGIITILSTLVGSVVLNVCPGIGFLYRHIIYDTVDILARVMIMMIMLNGYFGGTVIIS